MTTVTRRLSSRRGSTTASDPYAKNAHLSRESSSILTIVRVTNPPPAPSPGPLEAPPSSPRRSHRRLGSNPNVQSTAQDSSPPPGRVSFAFSSFNQGQQQANGNGPPRRPASPHRAPSAPLFTNTRLNPEQLLEVAKQATNPRPQPSPNTVPGSHSPVLTPRSASPQNVQHSTVAPATFTPLPSDIYLPFLDRPAEVSALLASPPSAKLFALLAQTFPKAIVKRSDDQLPLNTAEWTFEDLSYWLTKTTREEASDAFWVQTARTCILLHSELIWERMRGALGVPPELDIDVKETEYQDVFEDDDESDDAAEDGGRKAFGHWEDWDAVLDSPIFDRHSGGSSPNASRRASAAAPAIFTQVPTPHETEYFSLSPNDMGLNDNDVIIEPVIAVSEQFSASANPPPMSLPASLSAENSGLGDIGEEDEDDDTPKEERELEAEPVPEYPQVLGLRISTPAAPLLPNSPSIRSATTGAHLRSPSFSARNTHSPAVVRSSSSSSSHVTGLSRSGSTGSLSHNRRGSFGSVHSLGSDRDAPYDPVADRSPGNPIFPSNFARLAVGPTLAANNPSLRSPALPPQFKHGASSRRRSSSARSERGNRFRRILGLGGDDYAITVASGSSAGGSVRDGE
ncbi:hypothetical protein MIND_00315000 [Mycena indigotica]|uniref:Uncharacterized protein n=1 Tax=Mycena indigotica TaxID=2126181 RepID=A0A8H6T316_9AGAR|nr:uncharacterized protein MIND_00315000 [Mycena indigotica]KAF7309442.1 hypothetical protein MIND_00315000 [Mycena indigotica]